ncbi:LysR family transcriptional regulator [Streptomyces sp. NPDC001339]|uniref:LysR family transcriptional regulator n=1 Tax=Streptomyces sp. NPDC001339 TaxID=3364563 RepID=UPI0036C135F0
MELQQMRYVVAVAETGGFTRAAERCHVVQSALSHQVARLEKELGSRLFDRSSRRVRLTAAGAAFLPAARQALEAAERARAEVDGVMGKMRGQLTVGAITTVAAVDLPRELGRFCARYPQVRVGLHVAMSEDLIESVRQGTLDVAFVGLFPGMRPKGVQLKPLALGELVAIVSPEHPLADQEQTDLRRLAGETFIDFPAGSAARRQREAAFEAAGLTTQTPFEVTDVQLLAKLVRAGLGVGMVPQGVAAELSGAHILRVRDAPTREELLVWSAFGPSPAAAAFLSQLGSGSGVLPPADGSSGCPRSPSLSRTM